MIKEFNKTILEALELARNADGYLIMVTRLEGDDLHHTQSHYAFRKDDLMPTLEEYSKLFQPIIQAKEPVREAEIEEIETAEELLAKEKSDELKDDEEPTGSL